MITLFKDPFFNTFDKVFDEAYLRANNKINSNITTTEDGYKVQLSVPGLSKDDVKISLKESKLTISYEKVGDEFTFIDSFKKLYNVPEDVDEKNITGSVENGVIEIVLPKSRKKSVERLISLN
jgi:HSP20 family protein